MRRSIGVLAMWLLAATVPAAEEDVVIPGPEGPLRGTLVIPENTFAAALIVPGSGPTDRNGNNPLGVRADTYRLLARDLAAAGIATLRTDKRGIAGSSTSISNADQVRMRDYVVDTRAWSALLKARTGLTCVWLIGHSEGGLITLVAARREPSPYCGVLLLATPGRPLGQILREQLRANPANAPLLVAAEAIISDLEAGKTVPSERIPEPLSLLFRPPVQPYLMDLMSIDPATTAAEYAGPLAIVQGTHDLQVPVSDADRFGHARPGGEVHFIEGMNHVLKSAPADPAGNLAVYNAPGVPLAQGLVEYFTGFVRRHTP
ncbi:MAG: alpha/beta fold hydrolase [Pseudomonadota bacterium]